MKTNITTGNTACHFRQITNAKKLPRYPVKNTSRGVSTNLKPRCMQCPNLCMRKKREDLGFRHELTVIQTAEEPRQSPCKRASSKCMKAKERTINTTIASPGHVQSDNSIDEGLYKIFTANNDIQPYRLCTKSRIGNTLRQDTPT